VPFALALTFGKHKYLALIWSLCHWSW